MRTTDRLKLVSQLLDLPITDRDGRWCGVVDDVELAGTAPKETRIKALLVGPGAYEGRMPSWMFALSRAVLGDAIVRVPVGVVDTIGSTVQLNRTAADLGLDSADKKVRRWIPRRGAL
jgi:sporulation protein YlmC with PRC-barrel domain